MSETHSGAVVFFGAIGDLAYKKIFPSLQGVVKREHLNVLSSVSPTRTGTRTNPKLSRATALRNTEGSILRRSRSWPA
jgi:glucose-6-phosphate 1-dehydrogenase